MIWPVNSPINEFTSGTDRQTTPANVTPVPATACQGSRSRKKQAAITRANTGSVDVKVEATATEVYLKATIPIQKPPKVTTPTAATKRPANLPSRNGVTHPVSCCVASP